MEALPKNEIKRFHQAVAEWVDGDALSAHYAYGNEYFCTEDSGKNSGKQSVFHPDNLEKVKNKFGIKVVSVLELKEIVSQID